MRTLLAQLYDLCWNMFMNSQAAKKSIDSGELMDEDLMECSDQYDDTGDTESSPGTSGVATRILKNIRILTFVNPFQYNLGCLILRSHDDL